MKLIKVITITLLLFGSGRRISSKDIIYFRVKNVALHILKAKKERIILLCKRIFKADMKAEGKITVNPIITQILNDVV